MEKPPIRMRRAAVGIAGPALLGLALCCLVAATLVAAPASAASKQNIWIDEILAGANGDSRVQFIEIALGSPPQRWWGRQSRGPRFPRSRLALTFHDATGAETGHFDFPDDPPPRRRDRRNRRGDPDDVPANQSGRSVLVATRAFEDLTGLEADFVMRPEIIGVNGMVCLRDVASNSRRDRVSQCVSYGDYQGPPPAEEGCGNPIGPPAPTLPIAFAGPLSLARSRSDEARRFDCSTEGNAQFRFAIPSPRNEGGHTAMLPFESLETQGENLFNLETFDGNGRTCLTCHAPVDSFGLTPQTVEDLFAADPEDPLFIAENVPELAELENACLMREGFERGLILENIDGFDEPPVFRKSPHLLNIALTGPYGLSGEFDNLRDFSDGAVRQHFPRTLARNGDPSQGPLDFREPTSFELAAMEAFQNSIRFPADGNLDLDRMIDFAVENGADAAAIERGRTLFFGSLQCSRCHNGPALGDADGTLSQLGNRPFDTGVVDLEHDFNTIPKRNPRFSLLGHEDDGCQGGPGDPEVALPPEEGGARKFSTPPLVGIGKVGPYFHDNSAPTLLAAIRFYNGPVFNSSPGGQLMSGNVRFGDATTDDLAAFLMAISVDPGATAAD